MDAENKPVLPAELPHWIKDAIDCGYEPEVCRSNAGYYIGAMFPIDGTPFARYSIKYWSNRGEAITALNSGNWIPKQQP